jgi:hypothetical protein
MQVLEDVLLIALQLHAAKDHVDYALEQLLLSGVKLIDIHAVLATHLGDGALLARGFQGDLDLERRGVIATSLNPGALHPGSVALPT